MKAAEKRKEGIKRMQKVVELSLIKNLLHSLIHLINLNK